MNISYFLRDDGACGYYRMTLPMTGLKKLGHKTTQIVKGDKAEHIAQSFEAEVINMSRIADSRNLNLIHDLKKKGKKIIVDYDDDFFHVSPLSEHYQELGTENVKYACKNGVIDLWKDGKNIDLAGNRERLECIKRSLELAHLVTTPTEILANEYRKYNDNVVSLPNCINTQLWQKLPLKEHDGIRLFWTGGSSHYEDWCLMTNVLPEVIKKHKNVKLVLLGTKFDGTLKNIPQDRIEFHSWVATPVYPYKTAILNPDIAIIPLSNTQFNRCKSPIKWIEMSALKVPSVVSYLSPYSEIAEENNGVFIDGNERESWIAGICKLIEDRDLRAFTGEEAYRSALRNFDIDKKIYLWEEAYKKILEGK